MYDVLMRRQDYNNFHRIDIHQQLLRSALETQGDGPPCTLKVRRATMVALDAEMGSIGFENGASFTADLIVAADGIRVRP